MGIMNKSGRYLLIFIVWIIILLSSGCSESDLYHDEVGTADPYTLEFRLGVPEPEVVCPRSRSVDTESVTVISVLVFSGEEETAKMICDPFNVTTWKTMDDGSLAFTLPLDRDEVGDPQNLRFIVLANVDTSMLSQLSKNVSVPSDVDAIKLGISDACGDYMVMSGNCTHGELFSLAHAHHVVPLKRNAAVVTVIMNEDNVTLPFKVYGTADKVSLIAGLSDQSAPAPEGEIKEGDYVGDRGLKYVCPTANNSTVDPMSSDSRPFVIVTADYNGYTYWYKLPFAEYDTDGTIKALDIKPNHKYEYHIKSVVGPGYTQEADALAGMPSANLEYQIIDVQPTIFNMASDGSHELGVTRLIYDPLGDGCEKEYTVKCYPAPASYSEISLITEDDWLTLFPEPVKSEEIEDSPGQKAILYTYKVKLDHNPYRKRREGIINVCWKGLNTQVMVQQDLSFIADLHSDITLEIYEEDGTLYRRIKDYWTFIKGNGTNYDPGATGGEVVAPILYGTRQEVNRGVVRTQGLHFPVMNGGRNYRYIIIPKFGLDEGAVSYKAHSMTGPSFQGNLIFESGMIPIDQPLTITFTGDSYDLFVAESSLIITAYDAEGNSLDSMTMDIYHTGFFDWSDYPELRSDRTNEKKYEQAWYYYGVEPIQAIDHTMYWLDRNIGARSSGYDVLDSGGHTIFGGEPEYPFLSGASGAAGGSYHEIADEGVDYGDPILKTGFGPKGYEIPSLGAWDELRHSRRFITSRAFAPELTSYYQAYYFADNRPRVYFPRCGQYQDRIISSSGGAGHYWTSTAAQGFEKGEIGKWLSTIVLSGNSSSESRARIHSPLTGMSARLCNVGENTGNSYQTCFRIKGATHVFLYADNGFDREWPIPWPGAAVATTETAFDREINYVYESSRNVNYKVVFNFVDDSGAIHTMAQSDAELGINSTGWDAEGEFEFDNSHRRIR